jgi:hypothetical protein
VPHADTREGKAVQLGNNPAMPTRYYSLLLGVPRDGGAAPVIAIVVIAVLLSLT